LDQHLDGISLLESIHGVVWLENLWIILILIESIVCDMVFVLVLQFQPIVVLFFIECIKLEIVGHIQQWIITRKEPIAQHKSPLY